MRHFHLLAASSLLGALCIITPATAAVPARIDIAPAAVSASSNDGNVPANVVDRRISTRWSANGDGQWIRFALGRSYTLSQVRMAWYQGNRRRSRFDIQVSADGRQWNTVHTGSSSGTTTRHETYRFNPVTAAHVRIVGHGNSSGNGWNSLTEVEWHGTSSSGTEQTAAPTFSPAGGHYDTAQLVTIASPTAAASIRYTIDGAAPDGAGGLPYTGPIRVAGASTLKAVATASGMRTSEVATAHYAIGHQSPLDPNAPPGDNFDLSHWKINLPINNAEEHSAAELTAGYEHPDWFFTDPDSGGMVFRASNHGDVTIGTRYTRSELREMLTPAGHPKAPANNWVIGSSSAAAKAAAGGVDGEMQAVLSVDRVSTTGEARKVGRVVIGQIHAPETEIIRLYYHKRPNDTRGAVYFAHDHVNGGETRYSIFGGPDDLDPADGIMLGEMWSYRIQVKGRTLTVQVTPQGRPTTTRSIQIDPGYDDLGNYFKAGVYNQNNTGDADDYVQATFYALSHTHP